MVGRRIYFVFLSIIFTSANFENSWIAYKEQSCCSNNHHVRHHRDQIRQFSCGKLYYKTLYLDLKRNALFVGAMDRIFRLSLVNINQTKCEEDVLILDPSHVDNCVSKGKSEHFDCRNHIRVIQPIGDGSQLYVCGTNAHNPKDWIIYANLSRLNVNVNKPGVGNGIAKCPYDPLDNSTALWVKNGNPGMLAGLYSGTNAEFTKADTVIFRTDLYNLTTGQKEYNFKRTLKYDSKWLDKANFVGSYDIGQYVLFFFSETAVEYINCGKTVYSRVARVCKNDTGGKNLLSQNWATYTKSRLNCSIPGEFPFYFDEIQSIYKIPGDDTRFYGTFTTSSNSLLGSAICVFKLLDIEKAFAGRFKEQASSLSAWLPVLSSRVPEPRPGKCVESTESLPDNVLNFIRTHPLMDSAVNHENNKPVFYKRDLVFTKLVVDKVKVDNGIYANEYIIYYVGTSDGQIYKILQWYNYKNEVISSLLDIFDVTPGQAIQAMEILYKTKTLFVASDSQIKQIDLIMCNHRYDSCFRCVRDPYCGWDRDSRACKYYYLGLLQDATNSDLGICNYNTPTRKVSATWGQTVHLSCFFELPFVLKSKTITWNHNYKNNWKTKIEFSSEKYIETSQKGIIILSINEADAGLYECFIDSTILCAFNLTIDSYRCVFPDKTRNYQQVYAEWCHEFERYKFAMKLWEKKHFKCAKEENITLNENLIPNTIELLQDATNSDLGICNYNTPTRKVSATWGQTVHLSCFFELPFVLKSKTITWNHNYKNNWKTKIEFSSEKYIETSQKGIIILSINEADAGLYECFIDSTILCAFNLTIDSYRCVFPDKTRNYQQVYAEWCHEFERYKFAMKLWERKHFKCAKEENITLNENLIPNTIE